MGNEEYKELLVSALETKDYLDGGGSSEVYRTSDDSFVVKIYKSIHDYELIKVMQGDPHFPVVLYELPDPWGENWQCVLTHKLETPVQYTQEVCDYINYNGRHFIGSLLAASGAIREKAFKATYPDSLADSLEKLYDYLQNKGVEYETDLNQPTNWGVRRDGTAVMIDPLYYSAF